MDMNVTETVNSFQLFQMKILETFLFDQNAIGYRGHYTDKFILIPIL